MFDFLSGRKADRRLSTGRRRGRVPITIGFEQLEGREMLSSGIVLSIIPTQITPLRSMPRPLVGSFDPESTGEVVPSPRPRVEPDRRWTRPWSLGGRFRLG